MKLAKYIILLIFSLAIKLCAAQKIERYNSFNYSVNEGLLQSTLGNIAIDKNNFCWISFPIGIQKFDGNNFIKVPVQKGLPSDKAVKFFTCKNGDLLISHTEGISKYIINRNGFELIYKNTSEEKTAVIFVGEDDDILYFFNSSGFIKGIDCKTYTLLQQQKLPIDSMRNIEFPTLVFSDNIINHKVSILSNNKLILWDLRKQSILQATTVVSNVSIYFLHLKSEFEVLFYYDNKHTILQLYNFINKQQKSLKIKGKEDKVGSRCNIIPWKNKLLISFENRIFEIDSSFTILKTELVNFQNEAIAGTTVTAIQGIKADNFGNLYLQTLTNGIVKVIGDNLPIKYYSTLKKGQNNILSLLPDKKNNRILAGTVGNGLMIFDTQQHLIKHIKFLPGSNSSFSTNCIVQQSNGDYWLYNPGQNKVLVLKSDLSAMSLVPITSVSQNTATGPYYFGNFLFKNSTIALTQSQGKLYRTNFDKKTVTEHLVSSAYIMSGLYYNKMIITHGGDELILIDASTFKEIKRISFKNTGYIRCFTTDASGSIYAGSNNGIYKFGIDGKILQHVSTANGLPDNCIYAMVFDKDGFLWCSTNKGIIKLYKEKLVLHLRKEDGLQENEFNTNAVMKAEDGEIFFGGVNGITSFYPDAIKNLTTNLNLLVTQIRINNKIAFADTAADDVKEIILPYNENLLSFDFIAMGNTNPSQYIYQYKMEGIDLGWLQKNDLQTVRYFLPPGKYVFKIFATKTFGENPTSIKEISITIHPPFWKTWWFIICLTALFGSALILTISYYNKTKYQKKIAEIEHEFKIQIERERISRDLHDSIGAYANAVLYKTELLEDELNSSERLELMNDLKFASKDIITSLRETVWALKNETYTGEECLVRIKNFVQPLAQYYNKINFLVLGKAPVTKVYHHSVALGIVRIVQESVSNSIKHTTAKNITVTSETSEEGWKLMVQDDGQGFDYEEAKISEAGNGLVNMRKRAEDGGFSFDLKTSIGGPTIITIIV